MTWNSVEWNFVPWNGGVAYAPAMALITACIEADAIWELQVQAALPECDMATKIKNVTGFSRGNDFDYKITIPTTRTINRARLSIKKNFSDPDNQGIFKQITTAINNPDGIILDQGGGSGAAVVLFKVTKSESEWFDAAIDYPYDIEIFDTENRSATPVGGAIRLDERVREAIG